MMKKIFVFLFILTNLVFTKGQDFKKYQPSTYIADSAQTPKIKIDIINLSGQSITNWNQVNPDTVPFSLKSDTSNYSLLSAGIAPEGTITLDTVGSADLLLKIDSNITYYTPHRIDSLLTTVGSVGGTPSGVTGDIQINSGNGFGTIGDLSTDWGMKFDSTNNSFFIGNGNTYNNYILWENPKGAGNNTFEVYATDAVDAANYYMLIGESSAQITTSTNDGYGGELSWSFTQPARLASSQASGINGINVTPSGVYLDNDNDTANWLDHYLVTKAWVNDKISNIPSGGVADSVFQTVTAKNGIFDTITGNAGTIYINPKSAGTPLVEVLDDDMTIRHNGFSAFTSTKDYIKGGNSSSNYWTLRNITPSLTSPTYALSFNAITTGIGGSSTSVALIASGSSSLIANSNYVTINDLMIITPRATAPTTPTPTLGMVYVNSTDNNIYFYNGTTWVQMNN